MGIFSGTATASDGRGDNPKVGEIIALVKSAKFFIAERSKKECVKVEVIVAKGVEDIDGLSPESDGYRGNRPGEELDVMMFRNPQYPEYFARDVQKFALAALGATKDDLISEEDAAAGKEGITEAQFEEEFVPEILGVDKDGKDLGQPGMVDGSAFVRIRTKRKFNKKGETDGNGNLKYNDNTEFIERVSFAEMGELIDDALKIKMFGSLDEFNRLMTSESA
jgi:hypothetical protein